MRVHVHQDPHACGSQRSTLSLIPRLLSTLGFVCFSFFETGTLTSLEPGVGPNDWLAFASRTLWNDRPPLLQLKLRELYQTAQKTCGFISFRRRMVAIGSLTLTLHCVDCCTAVDRTSSWVLPAPNSRIYITVERV